MIGLPSALKDFAILMNPTNLKLFHRRELMQMGAQLLQGEAPPLPLDQQRSLAEGLSADDQGLGQFILRLYFFQLFQTGPISLDLRRSRFYFEEHWRFQGEHFAFHFAPSFLEGVQNLYLHYYLFPEKGLRGPLLQCGLMQASWPNSQQQRLEELFTQHFQSAEQRALSFSLSAMLHSFSEIFQFIKGQQQKIPSSFGFFGLYLTSLYLALGPMEESFDVAACFRFAYSQTTGEHDPQKD